MRKFCVKLIQLYQKWSATKPSKCKMMPTCSSYGIIAIERYGVIKGGYFLVRRLFRCGRKNANSFDPVPQNLKGDYKWLM